jgi:outer membrane protein assembly factor BamB
MHCRLDSSSIMAVAGLLLVAGSSTAADWPQWRGPNRNGLGPKGPALTNSLTGLSPQWLAERIPGGDKGGRGSLVVHAGRIHGLASIAAKPTGIDEVFCLDAATGKAIWKTRFQETAGTGAGSSTPCIVKGKLYVVGSGNKAHCLNAENGRLIWEATLERTSKEAIASSIAIVGKVAVLLADVLMGLDAETGKVLWKQDKITGYESSPTQWNSKGRDYVICSTERETHGVDPADGKVLWSIPGGGKSTPVVAQEYGGDFLLSMSSLRKTGLSAYRLTDKGPEKLWTLKHCDRASSPVVFDGHVYAVAGGNNGHGAHMLCVHLDTGKVAWEEVVDFGEVSSPVVADGKVFAVCGTLLLLLQATPEKYSVLSQADYRIVLCTSPTIVDGRLYVRQANAVACYDLRSAP